MEIIRALNLEVGYDQTPVLKNLTFSIRKGKITVVLGTSGSGKSTLLKTLVGLVPPLSGEVYFSGMRLDFFSEPTLHSLYKKIGVLYQDGALLNSMSLFENVALPLRMEYPDLPEDILKEMVHARLSELGLAASAKKYPSMLSGGMRKRGSLARAIIMDPDVIFCDEPSAGLDPVTSTELDELLLNLKDSLNKTLVVVTHELRSIEKIADEVLVLNEGRMHFEGEFRELQTSRDYFIQTFFLRRGKDDD